MDAQMVLHRIGWRPALVAVLFLLAAELATVLVIVSAEEDRWQRCYGTRAEAVVSRDDCPASAGAQLSVLGTRPDR